MITLVIVIISVDVVCCEWLMVVLISSRGSRSGWSGLSVCS